MIPYAMAESEIRRCMRDMLGDMRGQKNMEVLCSIWCEIALVCSIRASIRSVIVSTFVWLIRRSFPKMGSRFDRPRHLYEFHFEPQQAVVSVLDRRRLHLWKGK